MASPRASISYVFLSSSGTFAMSRPGTSSTALSITSRLRSPRKSILSRPSFSIVVPSNWVTSPGRRPFCCSGTVSISGSAPITTAAAWIPSWRGQALERPREVDDLLRDRVGVDLASQLGARLQAVLEHLARPLRDQLRDLVDDAVRVLEHAPGVAHRGAGGHRPEGDDLRDAVAAVLLAHVVDDAVAAGDGEVDVHVGHRLAAGVEEPLEEKVVADRVEVGDLEASTRRCCRPPSRGPARR